MDRNELLAKFIKLFPCYADQIQFSEKIANRLAIHLISGETLSFSVWGNNWTLSKSSSIKNDIYDYNEAGSVSGLTE